MSSEELPNTVEPLSNNIEELTNSVWNSCTVKVPDTEASPSMVKLPVTITEPVIFKLPLIPFELYVLEPITSELADISLNITSSVTATGWPIEIVWSNLKEPSNSIPLLDNVTPVPAENINGFVTFTGILMTAGLSGFDVPPSKLFINYNCWS